MAGERETLEAFLDDLRDLITHSLAGMDEEQARRRLVPSRTTLLGLVQHASAVERFFFQRVLAGIDPVDVPGGGDATDVSWELDPSATVDSVLADHRRACEESRRLARVHDLDHVTEHLRERGPLTLRWIHLRMIEELSRHAGHADILREQIQAQR